MDGYQEWYPPNLVEIKAYEKFYRRHVVDIPRIKFFA
jgi:hypothetical protein